MASDTSLVFNLIARDRLSPALNTAETKSGKLKSALGKIGGPLAALGAAAWFKTGIESAEEAKKNIARTEAVIKSTGGAAHVTAAQVQEFATKLSETTGVSAGLIRNGENIMLTFTGVRNEIGKGNDIFNQANTAALDMAAGLNKGKITQDSVKASSIQLGKALNDPIKGVSALKRVGVAFTDQQKEQIKTLVKSGDTLGAQKIIMGEVNKEFSGQAKASTSESDKLKTSLAALQTKVGAQLLPIFEKFVGWLLKVADYVKKNSSWLIPLVGALGGLLLAIKLISSAMRIWTTVQTIFNAVMAMNPVVLITLAVIALVAIIVVIATKTDWFQKIWSAAWGLIHGAITTVWNWIKTNWPLILGILAGPIGLAVVMIVKHWTTIKNAVKTALNFVKDLATTVWKWVSDKFHDAVNFISGKIAWIKGKFVDLWNRMTSGFRNIGTFIKDTFTNAYNWWRDKVNALVSIFAKLPGRISSATKGMFDSIKNAFKSAVNWIIQKWNNFELKLSIPKVKIPLLGTVGGGSFTLSTKNIPLLAKGGVATAGGAAIVGEKGPEMISMPRGAQVTPLSRTNDLMLTKIQMQIASLGYKVNTAGLSLLDARRMLADSVKRKQMEAAANRSSGKNGRPEEIHIYFDKSGDPVLDALITHMKDRIRVRYAGDVNAALGK